MSDRAVIESMLLLADQPVPASLMAEVLERPRVEIESLLASLAESYATERRGFVLREVVGGWRLYTNPSSRPWLERFVTAHAPARLTGPALEVLAIVAYRGPISRAQIAELRGVDSDGVVRTLAARGLIVEQGRDSGPGSAALFGVSDEFLERMGLWTVEELPPLADFMPDAETVEDMESKLSPGG